jgi:hypothetical protein
MKKTLITTLAAAGAVLAAAYLTGSDGTTAPQTGTPAPQMPAPANQTMQTPMVETEECEEGYILLMPCPVCHTCPVCQANCGTAHALRCCLGNKKPASVTNGTTPGGQAGTPVPVQQHIMTNKAEAVKHAAGRGTSAPQPQTVDGTLSIITIESE